MKTKPYDYQEKIASDIVNSGDYSKALLMRMGTGKTITSLRVFEKLLNLGKVNKLFVICLKCKIEDWKKDIQQEFQNDNGDIFFNYEIINFESVWRAKRGEYYKNWIDENTMIIIDESQKIKNASSKVTKYMLDIYNKTQYKLILTGTPQSKQYIDYYPQMRFINSKDFDMSYRQWEKIYVKKKLVSDYGPWHYEIEGYNFTEVLDKAITEKSYYHDYVSNYDKPVEIYTDIPHSKEAIKFQKDRVWRDPNQERCDDVIADTPIALRNYMRQSCSGFIKNYDIECPKEVWLKDFLEVDNNNRIVIFCNYIKEVERLRQLCKDLKRPCGVYYGAEKDLTPFINNENGIAIVNYASGAVGINDLCIANIGIFYGPPDGDYILFAQAKARLDRIGQTKQPIFYYLQTIGSVEKAIYGELSQGKDFDRQMYLNWLNENGGPFVYPDEK